MKIVWSKRVQLLALVSGFVAGKYIGYILREWA